MKKYVLCVSVLFWLILTINSCSDKKSIQDIKLNKDEVLFSKFPEEKNIKFKNLVEFKKNTPSALHLSDSAIIIFSNQNKNDYYFYNYSLSDKKLSSGYIKRGRGPEEALGGAFSGMYKNTLWLFDITLKKIITLDKNKALMNSKGNYTEYTIDENYYMVSLTDNFQCVAVGNRTSVAKASKFDLVRSKKIRDYGEFYNIPKNLPLDAVKDAYTPFIFSKPNGEKIVLAYRHTDVIEIYNLEDNKKIAIKGIEQFDVDFKIRSRKNHHFMGKTQNTKNSFINGAVTNNFIYLVYSGRKQVNSRHYDESSSYGNSIYVYNWNGKPIKKLNLDRDVYAIGISKNDKVLFSYDLNTGYLINSKI